MRRPHTKWRRETSSPSKLNDKKIVQRSSLAIRTPLFGPLYKLTCHVKKRYRHSNNNKTRHTTTRGLSPGCWTRSRHHQFLLSPVRLYTKGEGVVVVVWWWWLRCGGRLTFPVVVYDDNNNNTLLRNVADVATPPTKTKTVSFRFVSFRFFFSFWRWKQFEIFIFVFKSKLKGWSHLCVVIFLII